MPPDTAPAVPARTDRPPAADPRAAAFCSPAGPEVFHAVAYTHDIWKPDPFDVEVIHADARAAFERLLNRATSPDTTAGRILLLLGESGSGKTHLMRAFRNHAHGRGLGYCGYLQMASQASNYARYVLRNLIHSLDQPYHAPDGETTGLMRLANALAEKPHSVLPQDLSRLREGEFDAQQLAHVIRELAELIQADGPFRQLDLDFIRALLYLQRDDPGIKNRILRYLRCDDLAAHDRAVVGDLVPKIDESDPVEMITALGRAMAATGPAALVLCVDQLEEIFKPDEAKEPFRRAMSAVCAVANAVPSSVIVIACLEDLYEKLKGELTRSVRDRVEKDPEPIRLIANRNAPEIRDLVARRLAYFYDAVDVPPPETDPTFPIPAGALDQLTNLRTRDVIDWCREYRNKCVRANEVVPPLDVRPEQELPEPVAVEWPQKWNEYLTAFGTAPPDDEPSLARLLAWAVKHCSDELDTGHWFEADEPDGNTLGVERHGPDSSVELWLVGLCDKSARGGALSKQIKAVEKKAGEHRTIIVRSTDFPADPKSQTCKELGNLIARGGRKVVIEDSDWRAVLALQQFRREHEAEPEFAAWLKADRPLSRLASLRKLLDLDRLKPGTPAPIAVPPPAPAKPAPLPPGAEQGPIVVGTTSGLAPADVTADPAEFTRHAAFLGGPGSGKTTLALNVIEQLLLRGIPAVLLDRKGDLCGYSRPGTWTTPPATSELAARRDRLRERVEVVVYTPGAARGRPLSIPLVPEGVGELASDERNQVAGYAAYALGGMMNYKDHGQDASRLAILRQAILVLSAARPDVPITLEQLIELIDDRDPALLNAIGKLDPKLFGRLVNDLQTLQQNKGDLFAAAGERLDAGRLLGQAAAPGKTRLSVISTKFLGDNANVEFWVAQLLLEVTRWANRHARPELQAVFLFDEADLYLPAQRKPATKEPLENLLRRARSQGVGLFLASQSPGDFDYKCRDNIRSWFLGRITQTTSLQKMKPMLSDCRGDVAGKLPGQQTGEFVLVRDGEVTRFRAGRSLLETEQLTDEEILNLAREGVR